MEGVDITSKQRKPITEEMLQQAEEFLDEHEAFDEKLPSSDVKWEYMGTEVGESVPANTNDYEFETVSSDYVFDKQDSSPGMKCIFTYKIYKRIDPIEQVEYDYEFADFS